MTLAEARKAIASKFGAETIVSVDGGAAADVESIPTGSMLLDLALGVNGFPVGRMVELFGAESSGKSTVAFEAAKACQQVLGRPVLYLDFEHAFDPYYVGEVIGVDLDPDCFLLTQPDTLEQGMSVAEYAIETNSVGLVIVDSVAAMVTEKERDGELAESPPMATARVLSTVLKKLVATLAQSSASMIFINHVRDVVQSGGKQWGPPRKTTPGGKALKFYASVRVELGPVASVKGKVQDPVSGKVEDGSVGVKIRATVVKNKLAPPYKRGYFYLEGAGIEERRTLVEVAVARNIMSQNGSRFAFPFDNPDNPDKRVNVGGMANAIQWLENNPDKESLLRDRVLSALRSGAPYEDRTEFVEGSRVAMVGLTGETLG